MKDMDGVLSTVPTKVTPEMNTKLPWVPMDSQLTFFRDTGSYMWQGSYRYCT